MKATSKTQTAKKSTSKVKRQDRVGPEDYGYVTVVSGSHAGRIGYFDDVEDDGKKLAVVFFGPSFFGPYHLVPLASLRVATEAEAARQQMLFDNGVTAIAVHHAETKDLLKLPAHHFPAFIAMNRGQVDPSVLGTAEASQLSRSYFENAHQEQWVAIGGDKAFSVTGSDIDWQVRTIMFEAGVTPALIAEELQASLATSRPGSSRLSLVLSVPEIRWLQSFLMVLEERINHLPTAAPSKRN